MKYLDANPWLSLLIYSHVAWHKSSQYSQKWKSANTINSSTLTKTHTDNFCSERRVKKSNNSSRHNTEERLDVIKHHLYLFSLWSIPTAAAVSDPAGWNQLQRRQQTKKKLKKKKPPPSYLCVTELHTKTKTHTATHTLSQSAGQLRYCG